MLVLRHVEDGDWDWLGSQVLDYEIGRVPDRERYERLKLVVAFVRTTVTVTDSEVNRAAELEVLGFHPYDALHLACAEPGGAEVLLTVDDRMLRTAARYRDRLRTEVSNPVTWLERRFAT